MLRLMILLVALCIALIGYIGGAVVGWVASLLFLLGCAFYA